MVCVFVFVCLWGSTFAGLAFCATLSMTKLIIIIIIIITTICLQAVGEECPWTLEPGLCCLREKESRGTCSSYDILCQELIVTPVY